MTELLTKSQKLFRAFEAGISNYSDHSDHSDENSSQIDALLKEYELSDSPIEKVEKEKYEEEICAHYRWENGKQTVFLCPKAAAKGVFFTDLKEALEIRPELGAVLKGFDERNAEEEFGRVLLPRLENTIVLYIPRKMCQKREYLLDLVLSDPAKAAALKVLVYVDDGASAVVTLNLRAEGESVENFCAGVLYCHVGKNANIVLNEVQDLSMGTCSMIRKQSEVDDGGELRWNVCELGGKDSASSLNLRLNGLDSSAIVYGLYFPCEDQVMKLHTRQDHLVPHTYSSLHYKGALTDQASAKWDGMVYVSPEAGQADGYQKNENLLLSPEAHVFSKPGLEIIMDDVKCSHGTTITNIDDNQIFYLTSRGIPEKDAERLVIQGYFDAVLNLITFTPIRAKLQEKISAKMK